jgi:hypothetical protein
MKGTEKQIAWAEDIRMELIKNIESQALKFETRKTNNDEDKKRAETMAQSYRGALETYVNPSESKPERIAKRQEATWWIENRDNHFNTVHNWAMKRFDKSCN